MNYLVCQGSVASIYFIVLDLFLIYIKLIDFRAIIYFLDIEFSPAQVDCVLEEIFFYKLLVLMFIKRGYNIDSVA